MNLTSNYKLERVAPNSGAASTFQLSAGTTAVNSAAVNCLDFASVSFLVALGAIVDTGTIAFTVEGSADGSTGWTAITGAARSVTSTDDDKLVAITVARIPSAYRFVRLVSTRGTANSAIDSVVAFLGDGRLNAPTHGATVISPVVV